MWTSLLHRHTHTLIQFHRLVVFGLGREGYRLIMNISFLLADYLELFSKTGWELQNGTIGFLYPHPKCFIENKLVCLCVFDCFQVWFCLTVCVCYNSTSTLLCFSNYFTKLTSSAFCFLERIVVNVFQMVYLFIFFGIINL